jgi:hypothetical protein
LKANKTTTPSNQQRKIKNKKLQHKLKENKTPNSKHIKMNKKENRVRNLFEHSNFIYESKI